MSSEHLCALPPSCTEQRAVCPPQGAEAAITVAQQESARDLHIDTGRGHPPEEARPCEVGRFALQSGDHRRRVEDSRLGPWVVAFTDRVRPLNPARGGAALR
jgi:hypothetical protein